MGNCIAVALLLHITETCTFTLGLENATGLTINEKHVIGGAGVSIHFAHGHTQGLKQIQPLFVLNYPSGKL